MSFQQTKEQERANRAWEDVSAIDKGGDELRKRYGSLAKKFPTLVLTNGLGHALAFVRAKGSKEPHHAALHRHFSIWVTSEIYEVKPGTEDLLERLIADDSITYRRATTEVLAFAVWIKRFAEALLPADLENS